MSKIKTKVFRIAYLILLAIIVQIVLICLYPRQVFRANEILSQSVQERSYRMPFKKQIALIENHTKHSQYDLFVFSEFDKQLVIDLKSETGKLQSTSYLNYTSLNPLVTEYTHVYTDTIEKSVYLPVTKDGNKYYLLKAWKDKNNRVHRKLDFLFEHEFYSKLKDSIFEIKGIRIYNYEILSDKDDTIYLRKYLDGYKFFISEQNYKNIKFCYPPYLVENNPKTEKYVSLLKKATGVKFEENEIIQMIMFFRKKEFYQELIFNLPNYNNRGFLLGKAVGKLDANNDGTKDVLFCIYGYRYLNARVICYDEKNKSIIWQRQFANNLKEFEIVDIDNDKKDEIIFSSYSPGSQPSSDFLQQSKNTGLPFNSYLRILDCNGNFKMSNNKRLEFVRKEKFISNTFKYIPESNMVLIGAFLPHTTGEKKLLAYDLNKNSIIDIGIKCRSVIGIEYTTNGIRIFDSSVDELRVITLTKELKVISIDKTITNQKYNLAFSHKMFGGEYFITSPFSIYDSKLNQLFSNDVRLDYMPYAFIENELYVVNISREEKGFMQPILYHYIFDKDYFVNYTLVIILLIELIILFIFYLLKRLTSIPIPSSTNSYATLSCLLGKIYFWKLQGNISQYYTLPRKFSYHKEDFHRILNDISDDTKLYFNRNLWLYSVSIYEIESHEEFPIIQTLAHDLKNQILQINFSLSNLEDKLIADDLFIKYQDNIQSLNKDLQNVSEQMKKLTQFSHINKLYKEETDCISFIEEIVYNYLNHPKFEQIKFNHNVIDCKPFIDQNLFRMAITNLINNALDEVRTEGHVSINLLQKEHFITFEIKNPCNIEEEKIKKIEEIGFSMKENSSGLGVPISKKIIEKHQGNFNIDISGNIFTVTISLPINNKTE